MDAMKGNRNLVSEAYEIIKARIEGGIASPGDHACFDVLGTSAVRLVPGINTLEARDTARHIQESLAFTIVASTKEEE